jgi:UDP-2-acetamido-2-deoxy-ribo-hexuluronate aminotransferase
MPAIKMVDLENQYLKIKPEIDNAISKVISKAHFIQGEEVQIFTHNLANFLDTKHLITCANGTDALQIALMALDLPRGSEVLIPSFSYIAAAEAVMLLGLVPVFVDADINDFNIDTKKIQNHITDKTKAIIPVHLFGQSCNMLAIMKIAQLYNLFVIEDNAQSIGADYHFPDDSFKKLGTIGHIGTTSFFPSKNLGCMGDGGALFTNDEELAKKIKCIANHGQKVKYEHEMIGMNSRLDTLQAAILNVKLMNLSHYNSCRQKAASKYDALLSSIPHIQVPSRFSNSTHVFHQYTLRIKNGKRDALKQFLSEHEIPSMVYYPLPIHNQPAYKLLSNPKDLNISEQLSSEVLSLPMHSELSMEQIDFISENIAIFFGV